MSHREQGLCIGQGWGNPVRCARFWACQPPKVMMIAGSVLDILIYVFDHFMLEEVPRVPEREDLARRLEIAGFAPTNVERALDWLTELASVRDWPALTNATAAVR